MERSPRDPPDARRDRVRATQAEEDKKAGRKPTRVKRDRSANNLTIISDDGWETVPTTTASVRRSSSKKERSQSPATVPSDVHMGGFGALLGGDKKRKDKDKKKKKKSRSKDSLTDLEEVSSAPFDEAKYRGKCKAAVAEYFSIEVVDEVVACAREELSQLGEPSRLSLLASAALDVVLDGKQKDRERVPQLLPWALHPPHPLHPCSMQFRHCWVSVAAGQALPPF